MVNNYNENVDLPFYHDTKQQEREIIYSKGMIEDDPGIWIPITCKLIVMRQTDLAYHCTVSVIHGDPDGKSEELFGGPIVSWVPKSKTQNCNWICSRIFEYDNKIANRRLT